MSTRSDYLTADHPVPGAERRPQNAATTVSTRLPSLLPVIVVAVAYFLAARLGSELDFPALPIPAFWAPPAILLAALMLSKPKHWWTYLSVALLAHLLALFPTTPAAWLHVTTRYTADSGMALISAFAIRIFAPAPERLDRLRPMGVLILFGGLVGPVISALVIAGISATTDSRTDFVLTVFALALIRSFAAIMLVPLIIEVTTWFRSRSPEVRRMRAAEACLLFICLAVTGTVAFLSQTSGSTYSSVFLYAPTAILVWAATRFGVTGTCTSALFLGAVAIWTMSTGSSSFSREMITERELSLLSFLVATCGPLLLLSATLRDRTVLYGQNALSEARFNSILSLDAVPMVVWHEDSYVAEANAAFLALTGYDQADLGNHSIPLTGLFTDAERTLGRANSAATLTNWGPQEEELQARDGRRIPVTTGGLRIPHANGQGVAYFFDLSRSRTAQAQYREAELLHTAVLASLHDQIVVLDREGVIIEANESWRRIVEPTTIAPTERLQVRDHYLHAFKESSGNALVRDLLEGVRKVLSGLSTRYRLEFPVDSPDGPVWFEISIEPLRRPEGGAVITRTEITERKRAMTQASEQRQQLAHLSRAAVLGELSGAFAHELNQPLTSILGNAEAALQLLTQGSGNLAEIRDIMRDIIRDDIRAADVIQRLRSMLARGEINREPVDLNQVVRDMLELARSDLMTRNVAVSTQLDTGAPPVLADRVQMQQVVLNLIVNACEAMSEVAPVDRKLIIATRYSFKDRVIECSVIDSGCGIAEADLERIFQPFVTTKQRGLGLGLAICRSIVEAHGGRLWAESTPRRGAIVRFTARVDA